MFLAEFIKFREKTSFNYNEENKQLEHSENENDQLYFEEISYLESSTEKLMEFDELMKIETDDTDPDTLFIELPESCDEEEIFKSERSPIPIDQSSTFQVKQEVTVESENIKLKIDEPSCSKSSCRDEDVIFGELVTSMLSKMEDDEKRKMKKAIMNILL